MPFPRKEMFLKIADDFHKWNFPNCIGAIDGKHVRIKMPYSLWIIADANNNFICIDVGGYSKQSDRGFTNSTVYNCLERNAMDLL